MRRIWLWTTALALLPACAGPHGATSRPPAKPEPYVRIRDDRTNVIELQIAIRKFVPARGKGPAVWLAGVSHIGETNYFRQLQRHLDGQQLVLFEGISDHPRPSLAREESAGDGGDSAHDARLGQDTGSVHATKGPEQPRMASLQTTMAASLGLAFQLDAIDYNRSHFRNSDLSVQELRQLVAEYGGGQSFESLLRTMEGSSLFDALLQLGLRFLGAAPKLQALSKLVLMEMIGEIQGDPRQLRGLPREFRQLVRVLIEKRNEKVMDDLKLELARKRPPESVSILFGTGHMRDFEHRLRDELNYLPSEEEWLTAFSIPIGKGGLSRDDIAAVQKFVSTSLNQAETTQ